jgi:hypothetical protein
MWISQAHVVCWFALRIYNQFSAVIQGVTGIAGWMLREFTKGVRRSPSSKWVRFRQASPAPVCFAHLQGEHCCGLHGNWVRFTGGAGLLLRVTRLAKCCCPRRLDVPLGAGLSSPKWVRFAGIAGWTLRVARLQKCSCPRELDVPIGAGLSSPKWVRLVGFAIARASPLPGAGWVGWVRVGYVVCRCIGPLDREPGW